MVVVLSMAAAAATSTDMVPPTVTENKHRSRRHRRPAFGDGCGTGIIGFAPASEHKRRDGGVAQGQKSECASGAARGGGGLGAVNRAARAATAVRHCDGVRRALLRLRLSHCLHRERAISGATK